MGPRRARSWQTRRGPNSPKQEPGPERVTRIELEFVAAGQEGRALDLGDHRGPTTDVRLADDPTEERGVDDAPLAERRPTVGSERPASARSASRADVPLPHGDRSTSPSANTVTLRWVRPMPRPRRPRSVPLPEDDPVDPGQLGCVGVDHVERTVERRAELALERDQRRQAGPRDIEVDGPASTEA